MPIDPGLWPVASRLLDDALDLPDDDARRRWLDDLAAQAHPCHATVAELLRAHARMQTADFLQRPELTGPIEAFAPHDTDDQAGRLVGGYRLIRELGRGGMGTVWLAERDDGLLKRAVALKLPHPGWVARELAQRLARERDILAALAHPHIARLYDAGVAAGGQPFLALEYVEGETLIAACDKRSLGVRGRVELFLQVLEAVQYAHTRLVIHRDLKPSNVLVDAAGQVKLLDFGVAKLLVDGQGEATLTLEAGQALTPDYASPEQILGQTLTTASDVYSLGVLLYQLLSGVQPYQLRRQGRTTLMQAIVEVDVPRPSAAVASRPASALERATTTRDLARALRGDLDTIVLKALKPRPADRFASAEALRADLQRYLEGRPVQARPDSRGYVLRKFVARNRFAVGGAAATVALLLTATAISLGQAETARKESERARHEAERAALVNQFALDTFARLAADKRITSDASREAMRDALDVELKRVEQSQANAPGALAALYSRASLMYYYLQRPAEGVDAANKELRYLEQAGESANRIAEAHRELALALYRRGEEAQAAQHARAGITLLESSAKADDVLLRARLWRLLGNILEGQGDYRAARHAHEAAVGLLERLPPSEAAYLGSALIALARARHSTGDDVEPQRMLERVRALYSGMPALMESEWGDLEWTAGFIAAGFGRHAEAQAAYRKAAAHYATQFGTRSANTAGINVLIASAAAKQGDYAGAATLLDDALTILTPAGFSGAALRSRAFLAQAALYLESGDLQRAGDTQRSLTDLPTKRPVAVIGAVVGRARFAAEMGRFAEARALLDEATRLAATAMPGAVRVQRWVALVAASIERAAGNPQAARAHLAGAGIVQWDGHGSDYTSLAARDCVAMLDVDEAHAGAALDYFESAASLLGDAAPGVRGPHDEALVRLAFGRALLAEHRAAEAQRQFDRAADLLAGQHPLSPVRALARTWQGIAAFDLGNVREARSALADVRRLHARSLAVVDADRAAESALAARVEGAVPRGTAVASRR